MAKKDLDQADVLDPIFNQVTVRVEVACRALGISTWSAYQAVRRGDFPVPTIKVGRRIVVPTAPLRKALGLGDEPITGGVTTGTPIVAGADER